VSASNQAIPQTQTQTPTQAPDEQRPDVSRFLMTHSAMRTCFAHVAATAAKLEPGPPSAADRPRTDALEQHLAMLLWVLKGHHEGEDEDVWPSLERYAPEAKPILAELEAEHVHLDALISAAADTSVPLRERADVLSELQSTVNVHLDKEEAGVVPLILEKMPVEEWERLEKTAQVKSRAQKQYMPYIVGWLFDSLPVEVRAEAFKSAPLLLRVLWKVSWRKKYEEQMRLAFSSL